MYFQDETRIGQQGSLTRLWAEKGTRPRVVRQQQFISANIFGAVCPQCNKGFALILPEKNTLTMQVFIDEFAKTIPFGKHAVMVADKAGWHTTKKLNKPENITFVFLPSYSPELNSIEQVWQFLKQKWLSNRCFKNYDDIEEASVFAWNAFTAIEDAIKKLCSRNWAVLGN